MSESFPSVVTFLNREGVYSKTNGVFHLAGAGAILRTSHDTLENAINHIPQTSWGVWAASDEHVEDFSMRYPQQCGLLQQTISDLVSEIAQVIEHCPLGGVQPLDGASCCIAGVIVQRFAAGEDAATIAQTLLNEFPGTFHNRSATNLVEKAIKVMQTVRPGWKRQVPAPDDENLPSSDNHTPSSADSHIEAETPVESGTESLDVEVSLDSSADSTIPRIPVSKLFSDFGEASLNETDDDLPPADMNAPGNNPVYIDPVGSGTSAANSQRSSEPAHTTGARSANRLFQYPNLRRFVPAA